LNAAGPAFYDVWNVDALPPPPRMPGLGGGVVTPSTFTGPGRPIMASLPPPLHDPQRLTHGTLSSLLPAASESRLASPKPWYSQVEFLTLTHRD